MTQKWFDKKIYFYLWFCSITALFVTYFPNAIAANNDSDNDSTSIRQLCQPGNELCKCTNNTKENGLMARNIDCTIKNITFDNFDANILPNNVETLDLSRNYFNELPYFYSDTLLNLIISKNEILTIDDQIFQHIPNIQKIDLSYNQIELISLNAFADIPKLEELILSHNKLKKLNFLIFSSLLELEKLDLSWNINLNESKNIQELDFFQYYGVTHRLKVLKLNGCNLNAINLSQGYGLLRVYLKNNNFMKVPSIPRNIKYLDFSENLMTIAGPTFLPHLFQLEHLYIEDMPALEVVDEYAFFGLPSLKILSLQNCNHLKKFHIHAFGVNVVRNETDIALEHLNLRGASLTTFNSTLFYAFKNLKTLSLDGNPLKCNCDLKWIKDFHVNTKGQCHEPNELRGKELSTLDDSDLKCDQPLWLTNIINGVTLIGLLILIICMIGLIIWCYRRSRRRTMQRHIGSTSPYARITIEPNSAENHF